MVAGRNSIVASGFIVHTEGSSMCFSLAWLQSLLVWIIIVCAIFAILKLIVPWVLSKIGVEGGIILQIINIVVWAFIAIIVIYVAFAAISCLMSMGGGSFLALPHR
jgi:hypothetical protein